MKDTWKIIIAFIVGVLVTILVMISGAGSLLTGKLSLAPLPEKPEVISAPSVDEVSDGPAVDEAVSFSPGDVDEVVDEESALAPTDITVDEPSVSTNDCVNRIQFKSFVNDFDEFAAKVENWMVCNDSGCAESRPDAPEVGVETTEVPSPTDDR